MKKLLALVLALVMTMSLVTISNAAFADADKIEHDEAVEVMNALGVINGMPDGSFAPAGNVTRAEMAKMISLVMLGNIDAAAFIGTTTDLTDINGHWAEGFIKYCYSQGVISGRGNGIFDPNANVTAVEAAKMLLVAIGYNASVQGYVGNDWQINIIRDAQISKFFDELSVTSGKVLTRDEAAQMIYNAINAKTITKSSSVDRLTGKVTDIYDANGDPLLKKTFNCNRSTLTLTGDNKIVTSLKDGELSLSGTYMKPDGTTGTNAVITYALGGANEWVGEKVEVLWKDNTTKGTKNTLDKYDTVYGVYNNGETEVVIATSNDIKSATDYTTAGKIKVNGVEYEVAIPAATSPVLVKKDFGAQANVLAGATTAAAAKAAFSALSAQNGDSVKFILNDNGKVEMAYVVTAKLGTVTAVSKDKVTISGLGSIKIADNDVYAGVAKDDVVTYTKLYNATLADAFVTVTKAETVSGKVTGYKSATATTTEKVTMGGTTYSIYNKLAMPTAVGGETGIGYFQTSDIDETFTLYLVNGYVAAAVQTSETANNYSVVVEANSGTPGEKLNPKKVVVLGADGVKTTLVINDKGGNPVRGDIITYTGSADNAKATIKAALTTRTSNSATTGYNVDSKAFNGIATTSDAVLFRNTDTALSGALANNDSYKVYKLRDMKSFTVTANEYTYATNSDGKVVAVFIGSGDAVNSKTSAVTLGIVSAVNGTVKIGDDFYTQYLVANNKQTYTVNIATGTLTKGNVVAFAPTSDDKYDNASAFTVLSGSAKTNATYTIDSDTYTVSTVLVKEHNEADSTLSFYTAKGTADGDGAYTAPTGLTAKGIKDNALIVYVDVDKNAAGDEIGITSYNAQTGYANALILMNSDGVITHIVVETSGEGDIWG